MGNMIGKDALVNINQLIKVWESLAASSRQMADKHESRYTIGYGYGSADAFESAAKTLRKFIDSLEKENQ